MPFGADIAAEGLEVALDNSNGRRIAIAGGAVGGAGVGAGGESDGGGDISRSAG